MYRGPRSIQQGNTEKRYNILIHYNILILTPRHLNYMVFHFRYRKFQILVCLAVLGKGNIGFPTSFDLFWFRYKNVLSQSWITHIICVIQFVWHITYGGAFKMIRIHFFRQTLSSENLCRNFRILNTASCFYLLFWVGFDWFEFQKSLLLHHLLYSYNFISNHFKTFLL